jgi:hypothetical protein
MMSNGFLFPSLILVFHVAPHSRVRQFGGAALTLLSHTLGTMSRQSVEPRYFDLNQLKLL